MEKKRLLEDLEPEKQEWILEMATHMARLADMLEPLASNGIEVSYATLQRFVRRHRERLLIAGGEDSKETVEKLAGRGMGESYRKGTLEAVRQRLYDQAMLSNSPEETQALFSELLKEEAKLKELELAERKQALAEEQARMQRVRLRMEMRLKLNGRKGAKGARKLIEVETVREAQEGSVERGKEGSAGKLLTEGKKGNEEVLSLLGRVTDILNRCGRAEEKVLEARAALAGMANGNFRMTNDKIQMTKE